MKGIFPIVLTAIMAMEGAAHADTTRYLHIEFQNLKVQDREWKPNAVLLAGATANDGALGGFAYSWVAEDYAEAYGGPTLSFPMGKDGTLWTAYGIGIEQSAAPDDHSPLRLGLMASLDLPHHVTELQLEIGFTTRKTAEPYWYGRYGWKPTPNFDLGFMIQRYAGMGPRIDFWLHRPGLGIWAAPLYDSETGAWAGMLAFTTGY